MPVAARFERGLGALGRWDRGHWPRLQGGVAIGAGVSGRRGFLSPRSLSAVRALWDDATEAIGLGYRVEWRSGEA